MEPNYIFGLTKKLLRFEEPIKSGWVLDTGGRDYRFDMGTPCLILKHPVEIPSMEDMSRGSTPHKVALLPFYLPSGGNDYGCRFVLDNHNNSSSLALRVGEETDFFDTIKELVVERVDLSKVTRATEFVKDVGPLTLLVTDTDEKRLINDLQKLATHMAKSYNLSFYTKYNHNGTRGLRAGDKCYLAVTVMDIGKCIPVFDPRKVDGIMLNVTTIYTESSVYNDQLINSCEFTFYFSNHRTNLLDVDGQKLSRQNCGADTLRKIVSSCKGYLTEVGQSKKKKESKKKEEKESE